MNLLQESTATDIHFDCPKCGNPLSGEKTLLGKMLTCPHCQDMFFPVPKKITTQPAPPEHFASRPMPITRGSRIRSQAESFEGVAILLAVLGGIAIAWAILGQNWIALCVAGGAFTVALWIYLIAQIIHIRANTEK